MYGRNKYYFFRCYHCGNWFYTNRIIKTKKCVFCNRSFQFKNSIKFSKICSGYEAIRLIQELKKRDIKESNPLFIKNKNLIKIL
ncbi:MAG: DUF1922 domain-containing protein [Promethearchaeota archaeon]